MLRSVLFALVLAPLGCTPVTNPLPNSQNLRTGTSDLGSGDLGDSGDGGSVNCICCGPSGDLGYYPSDLGPATSDLGPDWPSDLGPATSDLGPDWPSDLGPATSDLGPNWPSDLPLRRFHAGR